MKRIAELKGLQQSLQETKGRAKEVREGTIQDNSEGVERKRSEAARYYKKAADQGDSDAQFTYGVCLYEGKGVKQDYSEAARYFKMSADQCNSDGQNNYGLCLAKGHGVDQNYSEAARYYKEAADQGNSDAQLKYAECLSKMSVGFVEEN